MCPSKNTSEILDLIQNSPVIAAVKNEEGLHQAISSDSAVIFILYGTVLNIQSIVAQVKAAKKRAIVHIDLLEGLASKDVAVDFLAETTDADGIISTKPNLIRRAKEKKLFAVQRFFLLDSLSYENVLRQSCNADMIDILPGTMPRVIQRLVSEVRQPLIASGLLRDKEDIISALSAGAFAVSTTCIPLWFA